MKIVIFGGGGFIGSSITDRLLIDGHHLRIFERPRVPPYREFSTSEKVEWISGDMASQHEVYSAITGVNVVVHLVSTTLPKNSNDDPIYDIQSNVVSTLQLLNCMVAQGVKKIVFISSGGTVYGDPVNLPINENHPTNPKVSYGISKLMIEKYLLLFQYLHGIQVRILRVTNPYGERQRVESAQGAVGVFVKKALDYHPIEIWGDGSVTRDYIYISDVAEAFVRAIYYEGNKSIFNISSGIGTSLNDLVKEIEAVLNREVEVKYSSGRPFDVPISILDNSLAKKELNWEPRISLREGISQAINWFTNHL